MKKILFILIIVLAFILRFWRLGDYPALNADEAAIGYNAYSLIQTGKDEHGNAWPIHFQSFNDYKPGLYFYMVIPFVKVLGLNEWAVRLPGAAIGVLTVLVVYFLVLELFKDHRSLGLIASLLLAISPWHIHFSRGGWEVNLATFLITLGLLYFMKFINRGRPFYLVLCTLYFVLSLYAYHAARVVVPLLGFSLVMIYRDVFFRKTNLKPIILNSLFVILLLIPLAKDLLGPAGISRVAGVGLFADSGPLNRINEQRGEHANFISFIPMVLHNKAANYGLAFLENWVSHYSGEFLFLSGDEIQRDKVPETGELYLFEIITVSLGIIFLLKRFDKSSKVVFSWLLIAPLASALTFQSPHALRAHNMAIPLVILSAVGLNSIIASLGKFKRFKRLGFGLISFIFLLSFARYLHMYWVHMSKEYPFSSQYGVKELVSYLNETVESRYKKAVVTDRYDQPYILFLFYLKYDPAKFQGEHTLTPRDQYGFSTVRSFGKYTFTSITNWDRTRENFRDYLIAGTDEEILSGTNVVKEIYGINGYKYFQVVAN
ncbi:MAG: glycosyltransferase family 39 protein [Candidatus Woesebacteria bacterium]|nr:glycosyltransferase family 39 protein [Candidatus Woesebacteria bacterium]